MIKHPNQSGFTAVELLITLFIAAAFLMSGYQLYSLIIKDGGESRMQARASNVAYDYLQRYKANATNPCTSQNTNTNETTHSDNLPGFNVDIQITCPYADTPSVSKIDVIVKYGYGDNVKQVGNAVYVSR